jgi:hypothetical protein
MRNQVELSPTAELNAALAKTQEVLLQPNFDAQGHFGDYLSLKGTDKAIRAAIKKANAGLSYQQSIQTDTDGQGNRLNYIVTFIRHSSGEVIAVDGMAIEYDKRPQTMMANITYAKRASLAAAFGVVADADDDGQQIDEIARIYQDQERQKSAIIAKIKELMKLVPKEKLASVMAVIQKKEADASPTGLDRLKINSASMLLGAVTLLTNDDLSNIEG